MCYLSLTIKMPKSNVSVQVIPQRASNLKSLAISNGQDRQNQLLSCFLKSVVELSFRGWDVQSKRFSDCLLTFMGHVPVLK